MFLVSDSKNFFNFQSADSHAIPILLQLFGTRILSCLLFWSSLVVDKATLVWQWSLVLLRDCWVIIVLRTPTTMLTIPEYYSNLQLG